MAFVRANSIGSLGLVVMVVVVTKAEVAVVERERLYYSLYGGDLNLFCFGVLCLSSFDVMTYFNVIFSAYGFYTILFVFFSF